MRFSRIGTIVLLFLTALAGTSCQYYSRVMARKDLVDGAPKPLKENATKEEAETIKKKFDGVATIEVK